jgi:hypothetical protein
MKSSTGMSRKFGLWGVLLASLTLGLFAVGCHDGAEGDRCNPDLVPLSSDCNSGLTCQVPGTSACVEAFCCPTPASSSSNGNCNGIACPLPPVSPDAGM